MTDTSFAVHQNIYREVEGEKRSTNPDGVARSGKTDFLVIPAQHPVRDKLQPESSAFI